MKTLALITGSSRGFGKSICEQLTIRLKENVDFIIYARSQEGLESTEKLVHQISPTSKVHSVVVDMGDISLLENKWAQSLKHFSFSDYDRVYLFNNAGTLGPLSNVSDYKDFKNIEKEITSNITSVFVTSALFLSEIKSTSKKIETSIINITSLAAIQPFETWGVYCVGKAGREMLMNVITAENNPNIKTLQWSPGPMQTDMNGDILAQTTDPNSKKYWEDMKSQGKLTDVNYSVNKMIDVLFTNTYKSGAHIDVSDV